MRALATLVVALMCALGLASGTTPVLAFDSVSAYAYDAPVYDSPKICTAPERGPPASREYATLTSSAVDRSSCCASARSEEPVSGSTTGYTTPAGFAQVERAMRTTSRHVEVICGDLSSLRHWHVAAKTGGGLADEAAVLRGNADDVVVLGRQADTAVANGWDGHVVLNTPNWSFELNDAFIRSAIDQGRRIYLVVARQETVPQVTLSS